MDNFQLQIMEEHIFDTELGRKILALTKAGFKVSDLISDLVLREKIKHQILEVYKTFLIDSGNQSFSALLKEIDILVHYFYLGGHLNVVKEEHLKQLQNGFLVFKSQIVLAVHDSPQNKVEKMKEKLLGIKPEKLSDRQEKIMKQFQNNQKLQLSDFIKHFPGLNERTVRNDLSYLIEIGKITRQGKGSGSYYALQAME